MGWGACWPHLGRGAAPPPCSDAPPTAPHCPAGMLYLHSRTPPIVHRWGWGLLPHARAAAFTAAHARCCGPSAQPAPAWLPCRDLKSANLLVDLQWHVRVAGEGAARAPAVGAAQGTAAPGTAAPPAAVSQPHPGWAAPTVSLRPALHLPALPPLQTSTCLARRAASTPAAWWPSPTPAGWHRKCSAGSLVSCRQTSGLLARVSATLRAHSKGPGAWGPRCLWQPRPSTLVWLIHGGALCGLRKGAAPACGPWPSLLWPWWPCSARTHRLGLRHRGGAKLCGAKVLGSKACVDGSWHLLLPSPAPLDSAVGDRHVAAALWRQDQPLPGRRSLAACLVPAVRAAAGCCARSQALDLPGGAVPYKSRAQVSCPASTP